MAGEPGCAAREHEGLIIAPRSQPLGMERDRDEDCGSVEVQSVNRRGQQLAQGDTNVMPVRVFQGKNELR